MTVNLIRQQRLQLIRRAATGEPETAPAAAAPVANTPLRARKGRKTPPFIARREDRQTPLPNSMFNPLRRW